MPALELDWAHKSSVQLELGKEQGTLGRLVTNSRQGIKVELRCPRGLFTPTRIEELGSSPQVVAGKGSYDTLRFLVRDMREVDGKRLTAVLRECRAALARRG